MNIETVIKDLQRQKETLEVAIRSLQALSHTKTQNTDKRPTIMGSVISHISAAGKPQTNSQIRAALLSLGLNVGSLQSLLSKRARDHKDLVHKGRGLWGLRT